MKFLKKAYNREDYLNFLKDKFNFSQLIQTKSIGNDDVESFEQLGFITTIDDNKLPVFEIDIKPNTKLDRNRVGLRHLVAQQVGSNEGALAVFVDDNNSQWRFSFIAIEYSLTERGVEKEQTASKRFTYLFGEGAKTRTAENRFSKLGKQSTLKDLKVAFAVEALNKEFYDKLYNWYLNAQQQVKFPNDENAENHTQTNLIRFLTRILFVWFLKEKKLINLDLFDLDKLQNLIYYEKNSSFYKAILQNLFFATLNRQITDRSFRTTTNGKANKTNYLATNIYRYQDFFKDNDEQQIMALFSQTPFLNGGLFECLDREATDEEKQQYEQNKNSRKVGSAIRVDGFSDRADNELKFDNELLFNDDEQDLGLISLFEQYQFTVEESTPVDVEVALDPELLGKVFENLLATYNPETGKQARNATGSFYTPREIVSYMVDESLKQHFKTHTNLKNKIDDLFIEGDNDLNKEQIKEVITAIDSIKILDPAVGSGAYPMGVLQRLVFILEKIDPENTEFKKQQLDKTEASKKASIEAIEQIFSIKNQHNTYGKKLMLIESCIYGMDIQPIAIQICKLRFFISLTIEQKPNNNRDDNYGIKALPNLETKFIVANTLLPLGKIEIEQGETLDMFNDGIDELQKQLGKVRHEYFTAKTLDTKKNKKNKDQELRQQMLAKLKDSNPSTQEAMKKVVDWDLYNQNSISDWFDPEWMFGVKEGFDIVIGNPPYIKEYGNKKAFDIIRKNKKYYQGKMDIWTFFVCIGIDILKENAVLSFIAPNNWVSNSGASKARNKILQDSKILEFVDFGNFMIFESAAIQTMILILKKEKTKLKYIAKFSKVLDSKLPFTELVSFLHKKIDEKFLIYESEIDTNKLIDNNIAFLQKNIADVLDKIEMNKNFDLDKKEEVAQGLVTPNDNVNKKSLKILGDAFSIGDGIFNLTSEEKVLLSFQDNELELIKPLYTSNEINRYFADRNNKLWVIYTDSKFKNSKYIKPYPNLKKHLDKFQTVITTDNKPYGIHRARNEYFFKGEKILSLRKSPNKPSFSYVDFDTYVNQAFYIIKSERINLKYLTALFNSKLVAFWLKHKGKMQGDNYQVDKDPILNIPIKKPSSKFQQPFIILVDKIIQAKKDGKDTTTLETKIDEMVYQLYDLTADEIDIIETSK